MDEERRELTMPGRSVEARAQAQEPSRPASAARPWPAPLPPWWQGRLLAVVEGLTRTRLGQAATTIARRVGGSPDDVVALFGRTSAALATGLEAADAEALQAELSMLGVQAQVFDTTALVACPPARPVDEVRWDGAGLRLRTDLGVHAVAWRDLVLGLFAFVEVPPLGAASEPPGEPLLDLVSGRWERFRISEALAPAVRDKDDARPSPMRLAGAVLDKALALPCNEALTTLSIGQVPHGPVFADPADHEAWTALWLARARQPRR